MKKRIITRAEHTRVVQWMGQHPDTCRTESAMDLAQTIETELGIRMAEDAVQETRVVLYPDLARPKRSNVLNGADGAALLRRVEELENAVDGVAESLATLAAVVSKWTGGNP